MNRIECASPLRTLGATVLTCLLIVALIGAARASGGAVVQWFRATPSTITAGAPTTLRWHVDEATSVTIAPGIGAVAAIGSAVVNPTVSTTYTLTANSASGSATRELAVVVGPNPAANGGRFVHMVSPTGGQRFTAPATLRVVAAAFDPNGDNGNARNAARVEFYVDDRLMAQVPGSQSEYWVFKTEFDGVASGLHRVWARAVYVSPALTLDSESMWITVEAAPAYSSTVELNQDVVLSGAQNYQLVGGATGRVRLNGNGHRIRSLNNWSGRLHLANVDVFDLGITGDSTPSIDVATSNEILIEGTVFDTTGTVSIGLSGAAKATIRNNDFRSNMRMPAAQQPEFEPGASYPAFRASGNSSARKFFQGNRIGIGWTDFRNTGKWLVGGDTDAEANIVIGPRTGIWMTDTRESTVRGNIVYHVYFGGWSQGNVMELWDSDDIVVEHNVIGGGSWPIRGFGGTLRYNLVLDAGHEWLWITGNDAMVHHNVFVGGEGDVAPIRLIYEPQRASFYNNTVDGLSLGTMNSPVLVDTRSGLSMRSNAIVNMRNPPGVRVNGTLDADYNLFFGQQGTSRNYSDNRRPLHDVGALNAQTDPKFLEAGEPLRYRWDELWRREIGVRQILANYRTRYTPGADSPLTDAGEPGIEDLERMFSSGFEAGERAGTGGAGNDIGAVGSGQPAADDQFGRLP